jgi:chlorophyllide a reductase subunit Y
MGLAVGPQVPSREWRDLYGALDCAVAAAVHPFYTASIREMHAAGRPVVGSGPVGVEGTADWLDAIGKATGISADAAKAKVLPAIQTAVAANMIDARITVSGYEGSELLVARLLIEAGAEVPYVGTACPRTEWSEPDRAWLEERGTHVQYRASLEQDVAAMQDVRPDLAVGTTPLVQKAKALGIPSLYFTNMVSARPLFGAAGAGALAAIVAAQTRGRERFSRMVSFFDNVGTGETVGNVGSQGEALDDEKRPMTTLSYANGPRTGPGLSHLLAPTDKNYLADKLHGTDSETHGGEDVALFADGPRSNLVGGVIEQNVIFHIMAEAMGWR